MSFLPDFTRRILVPEVMDAADCDARLLERTIRQFRWINRLTARYRTLLARTVLRDLRDHPGEARHLVDLGAGGCDIAVWLLRRSRRLGANLRVTAIDADSRTVAWARAWHGGEPGLTIACAPAAKLARFGPMDYVFANHFLHHLDDNAIRSIVARVQALAVRGYVFSDIRRGPFAYIGVTLLTGLLFRDSFSYADGRTSVRKAFTPEELQGYAGAAGARVLRLAPARLALVGGAAFDTHGTAALTRSGR